MRYRNKSYTHRHNSNTVKECKLLCLTTLGKHEIKYSYLFTEFICTVRSVLEENHIESHLKSLWKFEGRTITSSKV